MERTKLFCKHCGNRLTEVEITVREYDEYTGEKKPNYLTSYCTKPECPLNR